MEDITVFSLPFEVIEKILEENSLSFIDVCNFSKTCSLFWQVVNDNKPVWKAHFRNSWPTLTEQYYKNEKDVAWPEEFRKRLTVGRRTMKLVSQMSARHFMREELSGSDFAEFEKICSEASHKFALAFMIDELMACIHHENRNTNLTQKYYSAKVLRHLRQLQVAQEWEAFKVAPPEEQILERGAALIAQWSQPMEDVTYESIAWQLNGLAASVSAQLALQWGESHAALHVPAELQQRWQTHNIPDNHHSPHVSRQIIEAISHVLFKELGYYGNNELYYSHENSYLNKVLELRRGIPITLSIVFESIARRLGVKCEPVSFPGHFLLRWRDTYQPNVPTQYFYIDVFNKGVFLGKDSCPQFSSQARGRCPMSDIFRFGPATPIQVMERMANNLEIAGRQRTNVSDRLALFRAALELLYLIKPEEPAYLVQLARFYMQYKLDVSGIRKSMLALLELGGEYSGRLATVLRTLVQYETSQAAPQEPVVVRRREGLAAEVKFAVGLVMHHRLYDYKCVIVGWDATCQASEEWQHQMNVRSLRDGPDQPFYHVLVNDGSTRYAAQENLMFEKAEEDRWVPHSDIGRYFNNFSGSFYKMNKERTDAYPDDPAAIVKMILAP